MLETFPTPQLQREAPDPDTLFEEVRTGSDRADVFVHEPVRYISPEEPAQIDLFDLLDA